MTNDIYITKFFHEILKYKNQEDLEIFISIGILHKLKRIITRLFKVVF